MKCEKNVFIVFEEVNEFFSPVCFFLFVFLFCFLGRGGGVVVVENGSICVISFKKHMVA